MKKIWESPDRIIKKKGAGAGDGSQDLHRDKSARPGTSRGGGGDAVGGIASQQNPVKTTTDESFPFLSVTNMSSPVGVTVSTSGQSSQGKNVSNPWHSQGLRGIGRGKRATNGKRNTGSIPPAAVPEVKPQWPTLTGNGQEVIPSPSAWGPTQQQQQPQKKQQQVNIKTSPQHSESPQNEKAQMPGCVQNQQKVAVVPRTQPSSQQQRKPPENSQTQNTPQAGNMEVKDTVKGMQDLEIRDRIPKRKDGKQRMQHKKGRSIELETNHLELDIKFKNATIQHYDVSVEPEKPYKFYREAFEKVRLAHFPQNYPAFDGKKNVYSFHKLPYKEDVLVHKVFIKDEERVKERELVVKIKWASTVNMSSIWDYIAKGTSTNSPQDAIQALDIVLRQPSVKKFCQVGRSYFTPPPGQIIDLGDGFDLWYGFFQSAIIGWKPYLNIDVAHKGFPSAVKCIAAFQKTSYSGEEITPNTNINQNDLRNFQSFIKGLKVVYEPPKRPNMTVQKRTYKVIDIGPSAKGNYFEIKDKKRTSVYQYFQDEYNYNIQFLNVPCLMCGSKNRPISLPLELCTVQEGQIIMKKMNEKQTRNMVRAAAVSAPERKRKIEDSVRKVKFNEDPCIREFGLSVSSKFTRVPARILDPPKLEYSSDQQVQVLQGVWRSGKFLKPSSPLNHWAIYSADSRTQFNKLRDLEDKLVQVSRELGMQIHEPREIKIMANQKDIEQDFKKYQDFQVVFVILPEKGVTYGKVKRVAELQVGLLTQCIKSKTLWKLNAATATNILLKLNAKLNGINHSIQSGGWPSFFQRPVMVVGADVTHPAPDQTNVPSVAAVAASHDPKAFSYNMIWRLQEPREEMIKDLKNIMREQLMFFFKKTGLKPEAILFYRDGVSEGQFKKVLDEEIQALRRACQSLSQEYQPKITFLVVQKRHHTRLFPDLRDAEGKNKNVPAGTVVNTTIVHPTEVDFYLVSHASIQGTSRPTKYHLLWDDANMSEDDLEEITYYLCHLFTRCTRSVSYPAPTYYAHLAAFRVRSYIDNYNDNISLQNLKKEEKLREIKPGFAQMSPMFFV